MKNALKSITCPRSASASVVDGKLILSFPHAKTPVVWQMDLDNAKASALEVREGRDEGTFMLVLKTPKGETLEIAPFENRKQAVEGLMAAANALENAHGQIRPASATAPGSVVRLKPASRGKWVGALAGLVILFILFGFWSSLTPRTPSSMAHMTGGAAEPAAEAQNEPGVAQSADQFLKGR